MWKLRAFFGFDPDRGLMFGWEALHAASGRVVSIHAFESGGETLQSLHRDIVRMLEAFGGTN